MMSTTKPPKRQRRNIPLQVRLTADEYQQISEAARNQGMPVATYIRAAAIQMASKAANMHPKPLPLDNTGNNSGSLCI